MHDYHGCLVVPLIRRKFLSRRSAVREYLQGAYWVLPTLGIVVGIGGLVALSAVPVRPHSLINDFLFQGTVSEARQVLSNVSATMITVTGIVFSLTVVSLQIASSQYSLRLLRTFLRDVPNQMVLAVFVCTFTYSTAGLHEVEQHPDGSQFLPKAAVTGALVLAFASTIALVYFLNRLVHSIQIDAIMEKVELSTLALVDELFPEPCVPDAEPAARLEPPGGAVPLLAPRSGYLQTVDVDKVAKIAAATGHSVELVTLVGDYVTAGALLGWCWRRDASEACRDAVEPAVLDRCLRHVHIGFERTLQQDIRFGLRQLVDIALRALSPGVNDPYTAIQVVHHVSAVEAVLASRQLPDAVYSDSSGELLVSLPYPDFGTYLTAGCTQIRHYGSRDPLVLAALLYLLSAVAQNCVDASRRAAVRTQIDLVAQISERDLTEPSDRAMVARAAASATEVVDRPGTLAPPPAAFGIEAVAAAVGASSREPTPMDR